ncbi:hypothetical protein AAC387_Pa05g0702 [Persea americana]
MEALSSPPTHLEVLKLYRHLERLPLWIVSLQNLTGLVLHLSELNEGPLSSLQSFPNLMTLRLEMANVGKELCFRREHFLPFKVLYIGQLTQLNQIKIEVESMSHIQFLRLYDCPNFEEHRGHSVPHWSSASLPRKSLTGLLGRIQGDKGAYF